MSMKLCLVMGQGRNGVTGAGGTKLIFSGIMVNSSSLNEATRLTY